MDEIKISAELKKRLERTMGTRVRLRPSHHRWAGLEGTISDVTRTLTGYEWEVTLDAGSRCSAKSVDLIVLGKKETA